MLTSVRPLRAACFQPTSSRFRKSLRPASLKASSPAISRRSFCEAESGTSTASDGTDATTPKVLWESTARLTSDFAQTEQVVNISGLCIASGLGMSLLGIASFSPPNPFMFGVVLATLQTRLAHAWMTRDLRANLRRTAIEVVHESGPLEPTSDDDQPLVVTIKCDGGLSRRLQLSPRSENAEKPSLGDILKSNHTITFLDDAADNSELNALLSSDRAISKEEITVKGFGDDVFVQESQKEAEMVVTRLIELRAKDIKGTRPSPQESLENLRRHAQVFGGVMLTGGLFLCIGGRTAAERETDNYRWK